VEELWVQLNRPYGEKKQEAGCKGGNVRKGSVATLVFQKEKHEERKRSGDGGRVTVLIYHHQIHVGVHNGIMTPVVPMKSLGGF